MIYPQITRMTRIGGVKRMRGVAIGLCLVLFLACARAQESVTAALQQKVSYLEFRDGDLSEVLVGLGKFFKVNVVWTPDVKGKKVTFVFSNMTLEEILTALMEQAGLAWKAQGNLIWVGAKEPPKPPPAPPERLNVTVKDGRLTLLAENADLGKVLEAIAQAAQVNILKSPQAMGLISGQLTDAPLEEGVRALMAANGWVVGKVGEIFVVDRPAGSTGASPSLPMRPPAPLAVALASEPVQVVDGRISLHVENVPLKDVLALLNQKVKFEFLFVGAAPTDPVTAHVSDVTVDEVLTFLLSGTKYAMQPMPRGNRVVYLIGDSSLGSPTAGLFLRTEVFPLKHLKAAEFSQMMPPTLPAQAVKPLTEQNAVAVTGTEEGLSKVRAVIALLDQPSAQRTEVVRLRYLKPEVAMQLLPAARPQQSVKPVTLLNALLVSGTDETIAQLKREISGIDQPAPQVAIEVMVTEVSANAARQLSGQVQGSLNHLKAALPGGLIVYQTQAGMRDLVVGLTALLEKGEAKLLATPRLTTVNGTPARIDIVTERYFRIGLPVPTGQPGGGQVVVPFFPPVDLKQIRAGIQLSVTPLVGQDGAIMLEVEPEVSAITGVVADGLPEISSRSAKVSVRVRDGQTLAIGGLRQREDTRTQQKTPLLGDLPLIGSLFRRTAKSERESELLVFLTPKVLRDE